jgi:hypothetical protein
MFKIGMVFVSGGIAVLIYLLVAFWLKVPAAHEVAGLILRKFRRGAKA